MAEAVSKCSGFVLQEMDGHDIRPALLIMGLPPPLSCLFLLSSFTPWSQARTVFSVAQTELGWHELRKHLLLVNV